MTFLTMMLSKDKSEKELFWNQLSQQYDLPPASEIKEDHIRQLFRKLGKEDRIEAFAFLSCIVCKAGLAGNTEAVRHAQSRMQDCYEQKPYLKIVAAVLFGNLVKIRQSIDELDEEIQEYAVFSLNEACAKEPRLISNLELFVQEKDKTSKRASPLMRLTLFNLKRNTTSSEAQNGNRPILS